MKNTLLAAILVVSTLFGAGCSSKKDATETAKDTNETKVDNEATATSSGSKSDTKDVSEYMVDLANTGRIEYELSKMAQEGAANAKVVAFAAEVIKQHSTDETELMAEAKKRNVTLPTTISDYGNDLLKNLKGVKKGFEFDRKYLEYMAEANNKGITKAGSLINETTDAELKTFSQKILRDDQAHFNKTEDLRKTLK